MENLEAKENNKEEDLVEEEAKAYVIIMGSQDIFPEIVKFLWKLVHIVKHLITLSNTICNLLRNDKL